MNEVLKNWIEIKLEKICSRITKGGTPTTYGYAFQKEGINFIKVENLNKGTVDLRSISDFISQEAHDFQKKSQLQAGDLLFSIAGTIGETCIVKKEILPANTNQALAIIQGFDRVLLPNFLKFQLDSFVARKVTSKARGGAMNNVSLGDLKNLDVLIPPKPEQRAIVAKIEQLFSELDNGIANLKAAKDKLEIYRQAVLKKAFEGEFTIDWRTSFSGQTASELYQEIRDQRDELYTKRIDEWTIQAEQATALGKKKPTKPKKPAIGASLTDEEKDVYAGTPKTWHLLRFIDLIKVEDNGIKRGPFGSAIKKAFFVPQGFKVYEQQNAINDNSNLGTYYLDEKKYQELEKFSVKSGDYIVSCSGTIGRIHKLSEDCEPGVINQALLKIVLDEDLMHSKYFLNLFRSEVFQRRILKGTRGTGMQNLASVDEIKELVIQLPPKDEQLQIIQEIETRLSVCDNILANIEEGLVKSIALRQSILKQAFEGKLLSEVELEACRKEPDWEPAEKLLERIKNEKLAEA